MSKDIIKQLDPIFKPRSIAIIGASSVPTKWGYRKLSQPINSGFKGPIYPVNPQEDTILGLTSYPSILNTPGDVDLAVIVIPAAEVPQAMVECVQKRVKGAIIISGGFSETGDEGKILQDRVIEIAKKGNIRVVGPNVIGIWSSAASMSLSSNQPLTAGNIAFISQSGTFGAHLAARAIEKGYGLSKFISIGNQADLTAADYIEYLGDDPDTKAIALYLEGIANGRRLFEVSREVIKRKPIVIYKAGRTSAGAKAALSHTASLSGTEAVFEAMRKQVGMIRVENPMQVFDIAQALIHAPMPSGKRIAIIGTGGQCVVAADTAALHGLEIPKFSDELISKLKTFLPRHAPSPINPVDWAGGIRTMLYEAQIVDLIAQQDYIDGIISRPPLPGFDKNTSEDQAKYELTSAEILAAIPEKYGKPLIIMRPESTSAGIRDILRKYNIPYFDDPDECARAMSAIMSYAETRRAIKTDEPD